MPKRSRDYYDTPESPCSPPTRRLKVARAASSPIRPSTSKLLATPHTTRVFHTPYSIPSDSPGNPFGLKRSLLALELPRPTSFGRHTPFRLQVVTDSDSRPSASQRRARDGIYRVVQIPNNYTFRHLHKLILYLFASDMQPRRGSKAQPSGSGTRTPLPSGKRPTVLSRKAAGKARADAKSTSWGGHYFEVQKQVSLFPESKRPGVIKPGGKTWAKLSSVRDRKLFRDLCDPQLDADTSLPEMLEDEDTEKEDWAWEAEDDFTIGHVWPDGPALERGIIYHHSPSVRVHITVNTLPIPPRRGASNVPFVFLAQGDTGSLIEVAHTIPDSDGNESYTPPEEELDPFPLPLPKARIERWNKPDVFQKFLLREAERERALRLPHSYDFEDDERPRSESPMIPTSDGLDISLLSSGDDLDSDVFSVYSTKSDSFFYPSSLSAVTPYPDNPFRRKRLERLGKRMAKLTKSGLRDVMSSDEDERAKGGKKRAGRKKGGKAVSVPSKIIKKMKGRFAREPTVSRTLDAHDVDENWDPFGDEAELCV